MHDESGTVCKVREEPAPTMKNTPLAFVQAGPMDPWASMQKALLDALVLH